MNAGQASPKTQWLPLPVLLPLQLLLIVTAAGTSLAGDNPPDVGAMAHDFELPSLHGKPLKLSSIVKEGPVVLVVLRGYPGYQCPLCNKQFGDFVQVADEFNKASATVIFIYPGPADKLKERAEEFVHGRDYPNHFQILLDPDYAFTKAYGLRWNATGETAYPSTFVIDRHQKVAFAHVSKTHGGRVRAAEVLKVLTQPK